MKKFILGYLPDGFSLTEFKNTTEADFLSEEWCEVEAETLEQAQEDYENQFNRWRQREFAKAISKSNNS